MPLFGQKKLILHSTEKFIKTDELRAAKKKTMQRKSWSNITKEKHKDLRNSTSTQPHQWCLKADEVSLNCSFVYLC